MKSAKDWGRLDLKSDEKLSPPVREIKETEKLAAVLRENSWESSELLTIKLGDVCTFAKGLSIPRDRTSTKLEIPYLHYGDIYKKYSFRVDLATEYDSILKISSNEPYKEEQLLKDGDIVYALTSESIADLGKSAVIINKNDKLFISGMETTIMRVNRRDLLNPAYLNYLIQSKTFYKILQQYVTGMKVYRVHPRDISRITIQVPPLAVQSHMVELLDSLTIKVETNTKINHHLVATSVTDSSPDIRRGKSVSRRAARLAFSSSRSACLSKIEAQSA